jgi:hypothetical protein
MVDILIKLSLYTKISWKWTVKVYLYILIGIVALKTRSIWCFILLIGGKPLGTSLENTFLFSKINKQQHKELIGQDY